MRLADLKPQGSPGSFLAVVCGLSAVPFLVVKLFPGQFEQVIAAITYLTIHNVAEFFSIMVSLSIFGVGWFTYAQTKDRHALFLSAAFLVIGLIDFLHTMSNVAMPAFFTPNSSDKSIQFWIAARFISASAFLGSAFIFPESKRTWISQTPLLAASLAMTGAVFVGVVYFKSHLPTMFIPGFGLTPFKIISEYVIILIFALAALAYWRRMKSMGDGVLLYYIAAFVISSFTELVLSGYIRVFDTYNILGHFYKVAAFSLIYWGIFITAVKEPHKRLVDAQEKLNEEVLERRRIEDELRAHRDDLEKAVQLRTAELAARESALSERTAQLEDANKELETFSYSVSHDLRAPLRAIDGYVRMILKRVADSFDEETKKLLEKVRDRTKVGSHLIDDLLALSKVNKSDLRVEAIDMHKLIERTWKELQQAHPDRNMTLKINSLPSAWGDQSLLVQAVVNILSNAIKFTKIRDAAFIEVGGTATKDEIIYQIKDNGVGFDMQYRDKLFSAFQRLHSDAEYEGTGIGLALVKRIINRHGGRAWAEGKVGEGATFYFTLRTPQE
jgi:signal transduction histidine kinase